MELNKLSYRVINWENEFLPSDYIELVVDGEPISVMLKSEYKSIPFRLFRNDDLPSYHQKYTGKRIYILGVCSCAEAGCGHSGCELEKKKNFVVFQEIFADNHESHKELKFSRENYDSVVGEIIKEVNKVRNQIS
ncbi:MAG TPA: hypothetical protein VF692_09370 [Pyrinomonadaceae bacterium]|jgi:hypothetical protein